MVFIIELSAFLVQIKIIIKQVKTIIITGASSGIGKATALKLSKDSNNRLVLISRNKAKLNNLLFEINDKQNRITAIPFDLISGDYNKLSLQIKEIAGTVDVLINNAGALVNKPFSEIKHDDFDLVVNTNFKGPFFLIQQLLPLLNSGAHIVNISSMGGYQGSVKFPGLSAYSSSKGALATLTECLALEFKQKGVSVNCLALGSVQTDMLSEAFPGYLAPLTSESMADYIADFALNGHKWMNGKILPISLSTP